MERSGSINNPITPSLTQLPDLLLPQADYYFPKPRNSQFRPPKRRQPHLFSTIGATSTTGVLTSISCATQPTQQFEKHIWTNPNLEDPYLAAPPFLLFQISAPSQSRQNLKSFFYKSAAESKSFYLDFCWLKAPSKRHIEGLVVWLCHQVTFLI